jgi:asparagine synthase (glutamine-hydrolysing)
MCGFTGVHNLNKADVSSTALEAMNATVRHRGPDHSAVAVMDHVGIGHCRLSILDLSDAGNQPMRTEDDRYTIVFNGEIYNFQELRERLIAEGVSFRSRSDTEVVLKAFQQWGNSCFSRFNGMFALAVHDAVTKETTLARDRFGIKPLYIYDDGESVLFASEMKAILGHPRVRVSIGSQGLSEYIWYGNTLGNTTIYDEIRELDAGSFMVIGSEGLRTEKFFSINRIPEAKVTEAEAIVRIRELLEASVARHLVSDVPVGIFLSGGIDSSAITAFASRHYEGELQTFSVGFDFAEGVNELEKAASIARQFGTRHHELHISGNDIQSVIETLVRAHDAPFGDAADIPLYMLTRDLHGKIKVVLQGDGGDEFFGGYSIYNTLTNLKYWRHLRFVSPIISALGTQHGQALRLQRFLEAITVKDPAHRNALLLTTETRHTRPAQVFNSRVQESLREASPFARYEEVFSEYPDGISPVQAAFFTDTQIILKDTFLEKVDKATMANSMEVRVPFLDNELTDFILSLPSELKVKHGSKKYLLKQALEGILPASILHGPKTGFGVPYGYWLQTALADYFREQVHGSRAREFLDTEAVMKLFAIHLSGKGNLGFLLWKTLIFAVWLNLNDNQHSLSLDGAERPPSAARDHDQYVNRDRL